MPKYLVTDRDRHGRECGVFINADTAQQAVDQRRQRLLATGSLTRVRIVAVAVLTPCTDWVYDDTIKV